MTVKTALSEADRFVQEVSLDTTRTWKLDSKSFNEIGKAAGELGVALNLFGLRRGLAKALKENRLELLEEQPKPRVKPGNANDRLFEAGVSPTQHRSIVEARQEEHDKARGLREVLNTAFKQLQARAQSEAQEASEQIVVYVQDGPLAGRVDHSKTAAARAAAIAKRKS